MDGKMEPWMSESAKECVTTHLPKQLGHINSAHNGQKVHKCNSCEKGMTFPRSGNNFQIEINILNTYFICRNANPV